MGVLGRDMPILVENLPSSNEEKGVNGPDSKPRKRSKDEVVV